MHRPGVTVEARERARIPGELGGKLAGLSLSRQVVTLATWPFLEQILGFLVATVDLVLSTRMSAGDNRVAILDALGLGGYVVWLMMILQGAVGTGVMALIARAAGARDQELATKGLSQGLLVGAAAGVASGVLIWLLLKPLIASFGMEPAAAGHAYDYLSVLCLICPIVGMMLAATNALRAIGDTRTPFVAMVVVNVVNALLSWLFVLGPEPFGGLGVRGLAWGSVLGWLAGLVSVLWFLRQREGGGAHEDGVELSLRQCQFRPEWPTMKRIARVGAPQALEMFGMWLIHSVTLGFVAKLAVGGTMGAHFIAIRIESMSFLPGFAIGTAGATLVGQYLGASNPEKAALAVRLCWRYAAIFMGAIGVAFLVWPQGMVGLILPATDPEAAEVIHRASPLVFLCGLVQPILATCLVMKICLRGAGATRTVMMGSFGSMIFFRALLVPLGVTYFGLDLLGIWILMFCDVTLQAVVFTWIHYRGRWKEIMV